ncbi:sensor domain-containing diguanylate cyclase [Paenibacillus vini]|uniref:sensor domain-containing diguanylate cyclase n=1 Tax=Paenibacillus vini TaxID=1476024 RepID=UPI0025B6336D|nr:sensor domain-containing diguanylate cyclase [Paenibacillus vini]MDN4068342.1 sensor domain-containing diguanylate cyclase [Paenibacillus vini]
MIAHYSLVFFCTVLLAASTNMFRFKLNDTLNKWILIMATLVLVEVEGYLFDFQHTNWMLLVFIGISVLCFGIRGGLMSTFASWLILFAQCSVRELSIWPTYILFATGVYLLIRHINHLRKEGDDWLGKLTDNSRQLNVFKEVSLSMQQTFNLDKLLQTILTSVTAGHGLGFNRALIMLMNEQGTKLHGIMGTGPMSAEEGYAIWDRITKHKYKLVELIEIKEKEKSSDLKLNERVKKIEIPLDKPNFLTRVLKKGTPLHIQEISNGESDSTLQMFAREFNMGEMAVFPLVSQGIKVGVLLIDNPVNKKPITATDIDSVLPLANQAAIAIQQSRLYTALEDMALKDGLTGLHNQRAFQSLLTQFWPGSGESPLALILLDIDYFKHFNDTNGHLLGNEVLVRLADVIRSSIRKNDKAFRFGGEEFVVLLPDTDKEEAALVAERIRTQVEKEDFPGGNKQPAGRLTVSLGVASSSDKSSPLTPLELVDTADQALYQAKAEGKNRVVS